MVLRIGMVLGCLWALPAQGDAYARLTPATLEKMHASAEQWAAERGAVPIETGYEDVRAILHCHSHWSHDSNGTLEEILAAANKTNVKVIMFTEHPADHYDFINDGHQGLHDGVLLIPGAELNGMLAYPKTSLKGLSFNGPQEQSDMIARTGGLAFYCHLEERMDWQVAGISGTEMYNVHADAKEEARLFLGLANPLFWLQLRPMLEKFPQETFAALQDYPADYLRRYDELCQLFPHTGVAGNDSHHNIGIQIIRGAEDKIRLVDSLGKEVANLSIATFPLLAPLAGKSKEGDVLVALDLDPYERAFRHVATHLLIDKLEVDSVWNALKAGRAYVAFDWMTDASGFVFQAESAEQTFPMGSQVDMREEMTLRCAAPLAGKVRIMRNGEQVHEETTADLKWPVDQPGVYRAEVWLPMGDEERIWILSNPIYIRPAN